MLENIIWYVAGIVTIPVTSFLWASIYWAFYKSNGLKGCVANCHGSKYMEVGKHFNITVFIARMTHRYFWSRRKSHKDAVREYWQEIYDKGGQTRTDVGVVFKS